MLSFYLSLIDDEKEKNLFESVYHSHKKQMFTLAVSILKNNEDAEDAVHDVFLVIAKKHIHKLKKITDEQDIKNYLLKATKNTAINKLKKEQRRLLFEGNSEEKNDIKNYSDEEFFEHICSLVNYQELLNAINDLDKKYSDVLYMHFVLDFSVSEIAETLNRREQTVKKQLVRGKSILIEKFTENKVEIVK